MPPTPTSACEIPPVIDHIQKRRQSRKLSFTGPAFVMEERKKSASLSSLLLDENGNILDLQERPRYAQKSYSVLDPIVYQDEDLIAKSKHRYSEHNWKKIRGNVFDYDRILRDERKEFEQRLANIPKASGKYEDFVPIKQLGSGKFGRVYLVQDVLEKKQYAMKTISKDVILQNALEYEVETERNYLYASNSPFIVSLIQHFEDSKLVYFIQEYVSNGDLCENLRLYGPFSEELTRFYAGQIVLALEYLHNLKLIYRDLKPENIMVDPNHYLKLVDFGFVKRVPWRTNTFVGTPAYIAPEMISEKPYDCRVDWWSLGILIYEMLSGCQITPFMASNKFLMFEKITSGQEVTFSARFPKFTARDLIKRLLKVNPTKRLGNGTNGAKDIKNHPWFNSLKWEDLFRKNIQPPVKSKSLGKCNQRVNALKNSLLMGRPNASQDVVQSRLRLHKLL